MVRVAEERYELRVRVRDGSPSSMLVMASPDRTETVYRMMSAVSEADVALSGKKADQIRSHAASISVFQARSSGGFIRISKVDR